jgi:hypothetical protein
MTKKQKIIDFIKGMLESIAIFGTLFLIADRIY